VRGLGCELRSAAHKVARVCGNIGAALAIASGGAPTFDPSSDLSPHCQYRLDQGRSSACGGHAPAVWLVIAASIAGIDLGFKGPPSQRHIYACSRALEGPGGTGPLDDTGVMPADPILAIQTMGIRGMDKGVNDNGAIVKTPDGRCSDVTTDADLKHVGSSETGNVGLRPTAEELAASMRELVLGSHAIDPAAPYFLETLASALSGDANKGILPRPITATIFVDTPFDAWGDSPQPGPLGGTPNFADKNGGGHYVTIVGHRTEADGSLSFLILNSWSETWGVAPPSGGLPGLIWVTGAWLKASCSESYAIDLAVKVAA